MEEYKSSEFIYNEKVTVVDKKEIVGGRTKHGKNIFKRVFKSVQNVQNEQSLQNVHNDQNDQNQDHNENKTE